MDRYTSGTYADAVPDWHEADAPFKVAGLVALVRDMGWAPKTVVDVGCGTGRVLQGVCRQLAATGVGVDVAPDAIDRAPNEAGLQFRVGGVAQAGVSDLVVAVDVVEHVADDIGFVAQLAQVAPRIVVRVPLDISALDVLRPQRMLAARDNWGHRHVYTVDLAHALIRDAGLTIVHSRTDRVPVVPKSTRARLSDTARRIGHSVAPFAVTRWFGGYSLLIACTA